MAVVLSIPDDVGMGNKRGLGYPTDVTDEEWAFAAPYLTLCKAYAAQRDYPRPALYREERQPGADDGA
jgi:hypothetical protein